MAQLKTRQRKRVRVNRIDSKTSHQKEQAAINTVRLDSLVDGISKSMKQVEKLKASIDQDMKELEGMMMKTNLRTWQAKLGQAAIVTPPTRASNTIDVEKFSSMVSHDEFMESATVTMKAAQNLLAGKDLEKAIIHGRTKQKPDELKVTPNK